jgi:hypothetical protein
MRLSILTGPIVARALAWLLLLTAPLVSVHAQQQQPLTLMRLGYMEKGERAEAKVIAEAGAAPSPLRGKPLPTVAILPGQTIATGVPPVDVVVDFYHGTASIGGDLLCSIRIRYFRDPKGKFVPHYQIYPDPVVFRDPGGRWIPIESLCSNPSMLKFRSPAAANREGFYAALEFGLTDRALQIDSWVVR